MRGLGDAKKPLYASIVTTCLLKVVWVYTVFRIPACHNFFWLAVSYPASWVLTIVANTFMIKKDFKMLDRQRIKNEKDNLIVARPLD